MAKKPDTAEQLAKAAEAKARRDALQATALGSDVPAIQQHEPVVAPPPARPPAPVTPVEHVDGDDDKAALVEAGEDDGAPARPQRARATKPQAKQQASRIDTVAVTYHGPAIVRQQLKMLSAERDRKMGDLVAEALNLLFKRYDKPAVAPRDK